MTGLNATGAWDAPPGDWPAGGGDLGALVRSFDWSKTSLGPKATWPQSLKTAVDILLQSPVPIVMLWGADGVMIYNDAYSVFAGLRHPSLLGCKVLEGWPEVAAFNANVMRVGLSGGTLAYRDQHLVLYRNGKPEDVWMNLDYSPVLDESGRPAGVLAVVVETTGRVIGERRLRTLRELGSRTTSPDTSEKVCAAVAEVLADNRDDLPAALLYLLTGSDQARLAASVGATARDDSQVIDLRSNAPDAQALERARATGRDVEVAASAFRSIPPAPHRSSRSLVLPITAHETPAGFLVVGLNEFLTTPGDYHDFLRLVASQISKSITTVDALAAERRRAEALAEIDRAKTAFFSNVSHEFRTPLTLMLGPVEDLLARPADQQTPEARQSLDVVHRNALRLLKLVNSLLDFARIEAGRVQASYEPTDLAAYTADLASNFRSAVERAGLRLNVECSTLPEPVYVDRDMWEKIVLNLLSNAFKFTFEGEIAVALRVAGRNVELTVRDTGVGIPEADVPRLFERFHRVEGTRARTHEGSGIGLALIQELARLHGGTIRVASVAGEGSTFTVSIPRGRSHLPAEQVRAPRDLPATALGAAPFVEELLRWAPGDGLTPNPSPALLERGQGGEAAPRVLVADDNADMREYVRHLLAGRYAVETAQDGVVALQKIRARQPDLVVADVMMPNLDGFGLLRKLREDAPTSTLPVILLSARAGEEARVEGLRQGADDYVVKPFNARELLARVDATLALTRVRRDAETAVREAMTREQVARGEAEEAHRHLHDLFMEAPAIICILRGPEHVFELANPLYLSVVGNRDLLGKPAREALPELNGQGIFEILDRVYQTGEAHIGTELPVQLDRHGDGTTEEVYFNFVYQAFRGPDGQIEGILVHAVDVTDQVRARRSIEAAIRARDEFLSIAAHELKTPVTSIRGSAQLLARTMDRGQLDDARLRRYVGTITGSAERLTALTNDLLDVSRIQTGRLALHISTFDLRDLVRDLVDRFREGLEGKHPIKLAVPNRACPISADAARLEQILLNLLDNAAKYSPAGGTIQVTVKADSRNVILRVRDGGIGLPPVDRERIFEPFGRAENATREHLPGMGLGLYICRRIAEQHGGRIWAESPGEGQGTTMVVTLPHREGTGG